MRVENKMYKKKRGCVPHPSNLSRKHRLHTYHIEKEESEERSRRDGRKKKRGTEAEEVSQYNRKHFKTRDYLANDAGEEERSLERAKEKDRR